MSWRDTWQDLIASHLLEYEAQALLLGDRLDFDKALTHISRNKYPASRTGWAYSSWLAAIKWTRQRINEGRSPSEISRIDWKQFDSKHSIEGYQVFQIEFLQ
jgi:hypothetical protein